MENETQEKTSTAADRPPVMAVMAEVLGFAGRSLPLEKMIADVETTGYRYLHSNPTGHPGVYIVLFRRVDAS